MDQQTSHILIRVIEIVWIDLILSGDNAILLATATRALPQSQRRSGVLLGSVVFMLLRVILALAFLAVAPTPGFGGLGACLLIWAAVDLGAEAKAAPRAAPMRNLLAVLAGCLAADAAPALQNMLAVQAAAQGSRPLVMLGLGLSFPMLALGGSPMVGLLRRPPALWASVALLGWLAGQLAASDPFLEALPLPSGLFLGDFAPPVVALLTLLLAYGVFRGRKLKRAPL